MNTITKQLKALYEECFSDSKECVEYLFSNRLGIHNAKYKTLNGNIAVAMYLVDKTLVYKDKIISTPFVVGLSTKPEYRKKGLAAALMKDALCNLNSPFIMLYPAVEGFYEKMDFATISYDNILTDEHMLQECDSPEKIAAIYNLYNKENDFYIKLDIKDFEEKIIITQKDNGKFYLIKKDGIVIGFTNKEEAVVLDEKPCRSGVMARVVNLQKAFELVGVTIKTRIKLTDKLIEKNNITFYVEEGKIIKCKDYDLQMSVSELSLHFFGLGSQLKDFDKTKGQILERF